MNKEVPPFSPEEEQPPQSGHKIEEKMLNKAGAGARLERMIRGKDVQGGEQFTPGTPVQVRESGVKGTVEAYGAPEDGQEEVLTVAVLTENGLSHYRIDELEVIDEE